MPLTLTRLTEAYAVAGVISIYLLGAGNLLSIHQARGVNRRPSFRSVRRAAVQAMLFVIYPIAFLPARSPILRGSLFDSQLAFYAVLGFDAAVGLVLYRVALDSAVSAADRLKERMVAALSAGDGPVTA